MKNYLLLLVLAFPGMNAFAQEAKENPLSVSVGAELATPIGYLKDYNGFGVGASILAEYRLSKKFSTTFSAGYIRYAGQTNGYKYPAVNQVPVLIGARYYFVKNVYVSGQLGISHYSGGSGTAFTYSPGIGVKFKKFDATLKYMSSSFTGVKFQNVSLSIAIKL